MKRILLLANLLSLFALMGLAALYGLWPEHLQRLGLVGETAKVVMLQLMSFMLLLAALQSTLEHAWRRFALVASFVVLSQSLMLTLLRNH